MQPLRHVFHIVPTGLKRSPVYLVQRQFTAVRSPPFTPAIL